MEDKFDFEELKAQVAEEMKKEEEAKKEAKKQPSDKLFGVSKKMWLLLGIIVAALIAIVAVFLII